MPEAPAGPRPFWSGTLAFGLVSVPVQLFAANRSSGPSLRMVDEGGTPLSRRYVCPEEGREVSRDEIIRGYEVRDGEYVVVTEEELEALEPEKTREIDLRLFVPVEELDPVFFQRAYILTPAEGSAKAYRLLARVMEDTGRAGLATFVMRSREYLVAIFADAGILRAETMRFHDEIRTPDDIGVPGDATAPAGRVKALAAAMEAEAEEAIDRDELRDRAAEALEALVERKRKEGKDMVDVPEEAREEEAGDGRVIDLLEVLRRSLGEGEEDGGTARRGPQRAGRKGAGDAAATGAGDLARRTKAELYERAKELDIPGRSSMTKDELVRAIRRSA